MFICVIVSLNLTLPKTKMLETLCCGYRFKPCLASTLAYLGFDFPRESVLISLQKSSITRFCSENEDNL